MAGTTERRHKYQDLWSPFAYFIPFYLTQTLVSALVLLLKTKLKSLLGHDLEIRALHEVPFGEAINAFPKLM